MTFPRTLTAIGNYKVRSMKVELSQVLKSLSIATQGACIELVFEAPELNGVLSGLGSTEPLRCGHLVSGPLTPQAVPTSSGGLRSHSYRTHLT